MKIKKYLLLTSVISMAVFSKQGFAQDNIILNGNIELKEGNTKHETVEGLGSSIPFSFNSGDFEDDLILNKNTLYNPTFIPIPQGHLKWKSLPEESTIPESWQPYDLCDNTLCYTMIDENTGWFVDVDYYVFNVIEGHDTSNFYTTMYYPENSTEAYGEIVIELVFDDGRNDGAIRDTLVFGFLNTGVAINELDPNAVSIYPNPAQNVLNVSMTNTSQIKAVALFDINGRQMYLNNKVNSEVHAVNIENFATGTYLLRVENVKGESAIKKIQKL